jgi:N-methylhydantoinase B/oxoprolinase/acetone carboxylase alpha subunit
MIEIVIKFTNTIHIIGFQERLDFSCAMFGPDGGLVANAPHIPVHLGAMQETVQFQVTYVTVHALHLSQFKYAVR